MKLSPGFFVITAITGLILTTSCVSQHDAMIQQGYSMSYADGFEDGCHSGKKAGGSLFDQFKKDVDRFNNDSKYGQGWSDGFRQCESEQEAQARQIRMSIEQQSLLEQKKHNDWEEQRQLEKEALDGIDTSGLENLK